MRLKDLSLSDIANFGGFTLAGFEPEIDLVDDIDKRLEMIRVIGTLPTIALMAVLNVSQVKSLAQKSLSLEASTHSCPVQPNRIGTLAFFLPSEAWGSCNEDEVKMFLGQHNDQLLCLPKSQSSTVATAIQQSFG